MVYRLSPAFRVRKKFVLRGQEFLPSQELLLDDLRVGADGKPTGVRLNVLVSGGYIVPIPDVTARRGMIGDVASEPPRYLPQPTYLKQSEYPPVPQEQAQVSFFDPPSGTISEVLDWVGDDRLRARAALDAEMAYAKPRSTLVERLSTMLGVVDDAQEDPAV